MAHMIDVSTGKAACMVAGQPAWHKLGVVVDSCVTSAEAIQLAQLNWKVSKQEIFTGWNGQLQSVPGNFAIVRQDTGKVFGVVSGRYTILQNHEAFGFMDELVGEGLAQYETAGALYDGQRVWMLARLPETIQVTDGDQVLPYVLLTTTHDGSGAVQVLATTVRVVCNNTLTLALRDDRKGISIRHTGDMKGKVEAARQALGLVTERVKSFHQEVETLKDMSLTRQQAAEYFLTVFPAPKVLKTEPADVQGYTISDDLLDQVLAQTGAQANADRLAADVWQTRTEKNHAKVIEQLLGNFESGETNNLPGIEGSAWAAFNSVSYYADHQMKVRGSDKDSARLNSMWFGSGDEVKQVAYAAALDLARA